MDLPSDLPVKWTHFRKVEVVFKRRSASDIHSTMVSTATASGSQARSLPVAPTQEQSGPGMTIWGDPGSVPPGQVTVSNIVPDSSADHAGIQAGDVILQVDGRSAGSAQINTIAEELWGPTDSLVHVKLKRGTQIYDVTLLRENVTLEYLRCSQNIQHGNPDRQGEEMKTQIEQNLNVQAMLYEQALMQSLIRWLVRAYMCVQCVCACVSVCV